MACSIVGGVLDTVTGEVWSLRLLSATDAVLSWVGSLPGPVVVVDEAGPTGFGLARVLEAAGVWCVVVVPSELERPPGDRVKTDRRDAQRLARLLHIGELPGVRVPTDLEEAARDLVRAWEDARADLLGARHRRSKLLLGQGWSLTEPPGPRRMGGGWPGWAGVDPAGPGVAVDEAHGAVLAIAELAAMPSWAPLVRRLGWLGGIGGVTGFGLAGAISDWQRFTGATVGAWVRFGAQRAVQWWPAHPGLDHQNRQHPPPTAAGRGGLASPQPRSAQPGASRRQASQPATVQERTDRGNHRLHQRWCRLEAPGKRSTISMAAVARELAGWC